MSAKSASLTPAAISTPCTAAANVSVSLVKMIAIAYSSLRVRHPGPGPYPGSRGLGESVLALDMAVAPLGLRPHDDGPCRLGLCTEDYRATGHNNPDQRLEISWHKSGIFLKFLQWYTGILSIRRHLWGREYAAGRRESTGAYSCCPRRCCLCCLKCRRCGLRCRGPSMLYIFGECTLDTQRYELSRAGRVRRLRRKVFQVLAYLLAHPDRVIAKQELCEQVWPQQFISDAALESTMKAVRQAIGDSGRGQRLIQTVYGQGYRFLVAVEAPPEAPTGAASAGLLAPLSTLLTPPQA